MLRRPRRYCPTVVGAPSNPGPRRTWGRHEGLAFRRHATTSPVFRLHELSSLSEIVDGSFTQHSSGLRQGRQIARGATRRVCARRDPVTVPASGEATDIDVVPGSEFASYVAENTPNGTIPRRFRCASRHASQARPRRAPPGLPATGVRCPSSTHPRLGRRVHTRASAIVNSGTGGRHGYNPSSRQPTAPE